MEVQHTGNRRGESAEIFCSEGSSPFCTWPDAVPVGPLDPGLWPSSLQIKTTGHFSPARKKRIQIPSQWAGSCRHSAYHGNQYESSFSNSSEERENVNTNLITFVNGFFLLYLALNSTSSLRLFPFLVFQFRPPPSWMGNELEISILEKRKLFRSFLQTLEKSFESLRKLPVEQDVPHLTLGFLSQLKIHLNATPSLQMTKTEAWISPKLMGVRDNLNQIRANFVRHCSFPKHDEVITFSLNVSTLPNNQSALVLRSVRGGHRQII